MSELPIYTTPSSLDSATVRFSTSGEVIKFVQNRPGYSHIQWSVLVLRSFNILETAMI